MMNDTEMNEYPCKTVIKSNGERHEYCVYPPPVICPVCDALKEGLNIEGENKMKIGDIMYSPLYKQDIKIKHKCGHYERHLLGFTYAHKAIALSLELEEEQALNEEIEKDCTAPYGCSFLNDPMCSQCVYKNNE